MSGHGIESRQASIQIVMPLAAPVKEMIVLGQMPIPASPRNLLCSPKEASLCQGCDMFKTVMKDFDGISFCDTFKSLIMKEQQIMLECLPSCGIVSAMHLVDIFQVYKPLRIGDNMCPIQF